MAKQIDIDFNSFPFLNRADSTNYMFGANNAWVSDIWAFWDFLIRQKKTHLSSDKESKFKFLQALLEQARNFYEAAENAPIKSQPLLYYYAFMNFVKVFININDDLLAVWDTRKYMHGLSESIGAQKNLSDSKVICKLTNNVNVAPSLLGQLGDVVANEQEFCIKDLLSSCLGIHRAYSETHNIKENFFRLDGVSLTQNGKTLIFKAYVHECVDDNVQTLTPYYTNLIKDTDVDGNHFGEYYWQDTYTLLHSGYHINRQDLFDFASILRAKGLWAVTNGDDISIYVSNTHTRLSTEGVIYLLMFFFGSITRYRPNVFDQLLSDKSMWLMKEFLKTQPKQFIYLLTSRLLGHNIRQSWMAKL